MISKHFNCVDMCVVLIVLVDIAKLLCRDILAHFIFHFIGVFVFVFFGGLVRKRRRILLTALTSIRPGMACDRVRAIIRIGGTDR